MTKEIIFCGRKIQTLPAFAKVTDGQAIRLRKEIKTARKGDFK